MSAAASAGARWAFSLVGVLAFLAATALWLGTKAPAPIANADIAPAALFAASFTNADGAPEALGRFQGRLVVLNFWATWCAPCREELPALSKWQRAFGTKRLQVIGVSMDDDVESVMRMLAKRPVAYPVVMGDATLGESFGGVLGLPLSYLIDARGRVVARFQGEANLPRMEARIRKLLSRQLF